MKVTVTREEVEQTKLLMDLLGTWEKFKRAPVNMVLGAEQKILVTMGISEYSIRNHRRDTPRTQAEAEINALAGKFADELSVKAIEIIKRHMPIPIE